MAFYDIDLENKIESNHKLRKINDCIDFSSVAYRVNSRKSEVGRHGYGLDCGFSAFEQMRALSRAYQGRLNLWRLELFFLPF